MADELPPLKANNDKMTNAEHYTFIPLELKEANQFVDTYHRHNKHTQGHRFSIGLQKNGELIGVAIIGRPVARMLQQKGTLEILRVCVKEGNKNANSIIYSRVRKIAQLLGYKKIITYTLKTESQSSLKAIGAQVVAETQPQSWDRKNRHREEQEIYKQPKLRWELQQNAEAES